MGIQEPLQMEDLRVLQTAEELADAVWAVVQQWPPFARDTLGRQVVRATDSIGANIAEAFGRFYYGEKLRFLYYARGSVFETKYWLNRAHQRGLLKDKQFNVFCLKIRDIARQLNAFANSVKRQKRNDAHSISSRTVCEPSPTYSPDPLFSTSDLQYLIPDT